VLLQRWV